MEFELFFNGTPAQFGVMAKTFSGRLFQKYNRELFILKSPANADTNPVSVTFGGPEAKAAWEFGWVTAQSRPDGKSLLIVQARDEYWPNLKEWWELLRAEMERQRWIDSQLAAAGPTEMTAPGIQTTLQHQPDSAGRGEGQDGGEQVREFDFDFGASEVIDTFQRVLREQDMTKLPPYVRGIDALSTVNLQGRELQFVAYLSAPFPLPVFLGRVTTEEQRAGQCRARLVLATEIPNGTHVPSEYTGMAQSSLEYGRSVLVRLWKVARDDIYSGKAPREGQDSERLPSPDEEHRRMLARMPDLFPPGIPATTRLESDSNQVPPDPDAPDFVYMPYSLGAGNAVTDYLRDEVKPPLEADHSGVGLWVIRKPPKGEVGRIRLARLANGEYELRHIDAAGVDADLIREWKRMLERLREQGWLAKQPIGATEDEYSHGTERPIAWPKGWTVIGSDAPMSASAVKTDTGATFTATPGIQTPQDRPSGGTANIEPEQLEAEAERRIKARSEKVTPKKLSVEKDKIQIERLGNVSPEIAAQRLNMPIDTVKRRMGKKK